MTSHAEVLLRVSREREQGAQRYWRGEAYPTAERMTYVQVGWEEAWQSDPDRRVGEDDWPAPRTSGSAARSTDA